MKVLFVCLGNICRSPTAEGVLRVVGAGVSRSDTRDRFRRHGGLSHGRADRRTVAAARRRGYELAGLRARQVQPADFSPLRTCARHGSRQPLPGTRGRPQGSSTARLSSSWNSLRTRIPREVPDPYYGGTEDFERVLDLWSGSAGIADAVRDPFLLTALKKNGARKSLRVRAVISSCRWLTRRGSGWGCFTRRGTTATKGLVGGGGEAGRAAPAILHCETHTRFALRIRCGSLSVCGRSLAPDSGCWLSPLPLIKYCAWNSRSSAEASQAPANPRPRCLRHPCFRADHHLHGCGHHRGVHGGVHGVHGHRHGSTVLRGAIATFEVRGRFASASVVARRCDGRGRGIGVRRRLLLTLPLALTFTLCLPFGVTLRVAFTRGAVPEEPALRAVGRPRVGVPESRSRPCSR